MLKPSATRGNDVIVWFTITVADDPPRPHPGDVSRVD